MPRPHSLLILAAALLAPSTALAQSYPLAGSDPRAFALFDGDGDGDFDVAAADYGNQLTLLTNNQGDLSTMTALGLGSGVPLDVHAVAAGDLDGDGLAGELMLIAAGTAQGIIIVGGLVNPVTSQFALPAPRPTGLAVADLDGLPGDDAVIACEGDPFTPGGLFVVVGTRGTPTPVPLGAAAGQWTDVALCEANGDFATDLFAVVKKPAGDEIYFFAGIGDGSFGPETLVATLNHGGTTERIACADIDSDGTMDVIACDPQFLPFPVNELCIVFDAARPSPRSVRVTVSGDYAHDVLVFDHDANGMLDALVVNISGDVQVLQDFEGSSNSFLATSSLTGGTLPNRLAAGDINGDREADAVVLNNGSNDITVAIGGPLALASTYGAGCPGLGGLTPAIGATGLPVLGNSTFSVDVSSARASTLSLIAIGAEPDSIGLPGGCTLLVQNPLFWATRVGPAGSASFPLPVPVAPALLRGTLYVQWFIADPSVAGLGLAASDGLDLTVGSRQ